jgi:hypothetical protein
MFSKKPLAQQSQELEKQALFIPEFTGAKALGHRDSTILPNSCCNRASTFVHAVFYCKVC